MTDLTSQQSNQTLGILKFSIAFALLQMFLSALLMAFPIVVVMIWIRVLEGAAFTLFGGW